MATSAAPALLVPPAPPPLIVVPDVGGNLSGYIGKYIALRDKIAAVKKRHKEELAPMTQVLDLLENAFLTHLDKSQSDNAGIKGVGTIYRTVKSSATVADGAEFRRHVIGTEAWDIADWRANAPQVEAFIKANGCPPPGINFSQRMEVNVRKA